jgi:hypothetical protein
VLLDDVERRVSAITGCVHGFGNAGSVGAIHAVPNQHTERRKRGALREVHPLQEFAALRRPDCGRQSPIAMRLEQVFEYGS